jgi:hypothetical protein
MKEQIQALLIRGLNQTAVADAVGCDDSYISQLMVNEEFRASVEMGRALRQAASVKLDDEVDELEQAALNRMKTLLPFATKISEAAKVYQILNSAKRKSSAVDNSSAVAVGTVVTLEISGPARVQFKLSSEKQVIDIDGRPLATMPAKSLAGKLEGLRATRLLAQDVPAMLPISDMVSKL